MKRFKNIWIFSCAIVAPCITAVGLTKFRQDSTSIVAFPADIDFGSVPNGTIVDRVVMLTNRTSRSITIEKILTSCGCTTTNHLNSIGPHATADLRIRFDSKGRTGAIEKLIDAGYTSNGQIDHVLVRLHGTVKQFISIHPSEIVDLGLLNKGEVRYQKVEAVRDDGSLFHATQLTSSGNIRVSKLKLSGTRATFEVGVKAPLVAGQYSETVNLSFTDRMPSCIIPVQYSVASLYRFSQPCLNFGVIQLHTFPVRTVVIEGSGLSGLSVAKVPSYLHAHISNVGIHHALLSVQYLGNGLTGSALSSTIELRTNNSSEPTLVLPEYAVALKAKQGRTQ